MYSSFYTISCLAIGSLFLNFSTSSGFMNPRVEIVGYAFSLQRLNGTKRSSTEYSPSYNAGVSRNAWRDCSRLPYFLRIKHDVCWLDIRNEYIRVVESFECVNERFHNEEHVRRCERRWGFIDQILQAARPFVEDNLLLFLIDLQRSREVNYILTVYFERFSSRPRRILLTHNLLLIHFVEEKRSPTCRTEGLLILTTDLSVTINVSQIQRLLLWSHHSRGLRSLLCSLRRFNVHWKRRLRGWRRLLCRGGNIVPIEDTVTVFFYCMRRRYGC